MEPVRPIAPRTGTPPVAPVPLLDPVEREERRREREERRREKARGDAPAPPGAGADDVPPRREWRA